MNSKFAPLFKAYFLLFSVVLFFSCRKSSTPVLNNPVGSNGVFYIQCINPAGANVLKKIDTHDTNANWEVLDYSSGQSFSYDSGHIYGGSYSSLSSYDASTGIYDWNFYWLNVYNGNYIQPAFKDSLVFCTKASDFWDFSYLFCVNRNTGGMKWRNQLDSAGAIRSSSFQSNPIVVNNDVIATTRSYNNDLRIVCFDILRGQKIWASAINNTLSSMIKIDDGKIYSTTGRYASCYSTVDGSLLWQTDTRSSYNSTLTFFDQTKIVVSKDSGNTNTIIILDKSSGSIINSFTPNIPGEYYRGTAYANNTLYLSSFFDSAYELRAYNINDMTQKWKYTFAPCGWFSSLASIITDKYLIVSVDLPTVYNPAISIPDDSSQAKMLFLDFSGKLVTQVPYVGYYTRGFVYLDNGVPYKIEGY